MNNDNKAQGTVEAADLDNESLASVTGGVTFVRASATNHVTLDSLVRRVGTLKVSDLFGKNLLIDKLAAGNTDWQ